MSSWYAPRGRHRRWLTGLVAAAGITVSLLAAAIPAQADDVSPTGAVRRSAADISPAVPTSVTTAPAPQDSPGHVNYGCNGTGDWGWIATGGYGGEVTLQGKITDPDSGQLVSAQFEMWDGSHHLIDLGQPADAAAGTLASGSDSGWSPSGSIATKRVPTSYLTDGHSYGFRLRADDGTAVSALSVPCHFTYDATAPTIQSVNGTDITGGSCINAGTIGTAPTTFNLTVRAADTGSGLDHVDTSLSGQPLITAATSATASTSPTTPH
ncbi:hypothetical protein ACFO3J_31035 [Streptomyces polygonati]|uniref:Uncharacterized protein n=1 Tax=Streptomyces polygonati TaxID=1617087 RepID=A0ABV8HV34_9ACTN